MRQYRIRWQLCAAKPGYDPREHEEVVWMGHGLVDHKPPKLVTIYGMVYFQKHHNLCGIANIRCSVKIAARITYNGPHLVHQS